MALHFKIELKGVNHPPVWRRVVVPEQATFLRFHKVIQAAFGWTGSHLFQFSSKGWGSEPVIGMPYEDAEEEIQDCRKVKLSRIFLEPGELYTYVYDFGDNWVHSIQLETITDEPRQKADCLDGGGQCPPEDCGGPPGYEALRRVMADPNDPEHAEMKEWLGISYRQQWDADGFSLKSAKAVVQKI